MKTMSRILSLGFAVVLLGLQFTAMAQEKGYSHIRIVRVSFVNGTVLIKRPDATEWAKALVNTPIEQGFTISTSTNGFAETQFENGSTARLGESSRLEFAELALAPDGAKINHLVFDQGYGTFNFQPKHGSVYSVQAASATITPDGKSEFRVDLEPAALRVEVFNGSVKVADGSKKVSVGKGKTLRINLNGELALNATPGIEKDAWDNWVHARDQQTELALNDSPVTMDSPVSGWSDLDQYGEWGYFPGFGYGWSPYVSMGWSPFSMGLWSFYPGMGYTWISSEPWGWLPYHYGAWNYSPMFGYLWTPGGGFSTFYPGLVNWYQGAGYIGWAPMGFGGVPLCALTSCLIAEPVTALAGGGIVKPIDRPPVSVRLASVRAINVVPGPLARLSGLPVSRDATVASASVSPRTATPAPKILFMGQTPAQGAAEMKALTARHSIFGRAFGSNPTQTIHARLGNTIGGLYLAPSTARAMRGMQSFGLSGLLEHRGGSGYSEPAARMGANGEIRASGGADRGSSGSTASMAGSSAAGSMSSSPAMSATHGTSAASGGSHH
jgi:hypothetical protein